LHDEYAKKFPARFLPINKRDKIVIQSFPSKTSETEFEIVNYSFVRIFIGKLPI